jgi:hypothetical protein
VRTRVGSRPSADGGGRQLPGELNFNSAILDAPVIERMGISMCLPKRHCLKVALGFDHLSRFASTYQQVVGELPAQILVTQRWAARQPTDAAA